MPPLVLGLRPQPYRSCANADLDCLGRVEITLTEWEHVAAVPNHFVMIAAHQRSEGEEVVGSLGEYEITRKPD